MVEQNQFWMEMVNKFMPKKEECNKKVENMKTKLKGKFSTEDNSMKERDQALKMLGEAHVKISSLHSRNEELERELNKFRLLNSQVADSKDWEVENLDKTQEAKEEEVESEEEKEDTTQGEKASDEEEDEEEEEEEEEISLGNTDSEQRHEFKSKMKHDRVTEPIDVGRELRSKKRHDRVADHSITGTKKELRLKKKT